MKIIRFIMNLLITLTLDEQNFIILLYSKEILLFYVKHPSSKPVLFVVLIRFFNIFNYFFFALFFLLWQ